jgi:hypothetical protein
MGIPVQVTFDCADPDRIARFWAVTLDYVMQPPPDGFATWDAFLESIGVPQDQRDTASAIVDPEGVGPRLFFQKVPEGKTAKNRVHLDVNVGGGRATPDEERRRRVDAKANVLVEAGATEVRRTAERGEYFITMLDPEGNEFDLQ